VLEVLRGTPLLVQLIWFFYALPIVTGITLSPPLSAFLALSLYSGAFYAEIFRGGILSIEQGQSDAARSLGMTHWEEMQRVILPQAVRRMIPPLVNQTIVTLKNTSLASVVTVAELVYQAQYISSSTYRSLEAYTGIAAIYFVMIYPMTLLAQRLELRKGGGF
jgi:polar amino acid transport system permease protein